MNWRETLQRAALLLALGGGAPAALAGDWFERFKAEATDGALHRFLYAMPKGGDLHLHLTGSALSEWLHEIALAEAAQGVAYYVKTRIDNCPVGAGQADAYLLLHRTLDQHRFERFGRQSAGGVDEQRSPRRPQRGAG